MKHRKGYSPIYKWIGLTLLTGFVFTGALPERAKAEPVIYPVRPLTEAFVPVQVPTSDGLVERIGRRVRIELYAAAREINESGRTYETSASDRSGDLGTPDPYGEGNVLPAEDLHDDGEYLEVDQEDCGEEVNSLYSDAEPGYSESLTYYGEFTATAYCACPVCCGEYSSGYTASGTLAEEGRTIACNSLPFGTQVMIDGHIYTVEDTGWSPYGENWLDIFFNSHEAALAYGCRTVDVYLVN